MPNIPKLRLMLARMEKEASSRWRTLQGLTALLGNTAERWPRLGALQLAAAKQNLKLPGEGFSKALSDLPAGPIGKLGLLPPSQVFRGVTTPSGLQSSGVGYSKDYLHASPFKEVAKEHASVPQPYLGPMVHQPKSLIGVYDTIKNQKYAPNFGFESNKGVGYLAAKLQDLFRGSPTPLKSQMYETMVQPSQLQSVLLNNRVLPATAKGRELLQTGTMPAGAQLPPEILKSAEELPWRDRVEVYTQNPKGKIYGGIWDNDKSFALPGGGIDEGEDPLLAALRELKEETGINAKNPRLLPIDPVDSPWSDAHRAKIKRNFAGSRTHFVLADAMSRRGNKNLDVWNASNRGYYTPAKAIDIMNSNTNYMAPTAAAARLKALQYIQSLAMAAAKEKSAGVTKEELIHAYKANDPAMRILSQSPVTDKDFLYHASGKKFNALDPKYNSKRSYGHEYTEPVVFAGDAPSSAFASNPTAEYQAVKDKMKDSVYHRLIDELTGRKALLGHTPGGYLYKLPASAFTRIDREDNELGKWNKSTEYVSHRPVKPISVTPMQSTDVDAIPEYEYLGKDFVGEMPAQHYLKHAKNPKVIAAIQAWLANKQEKVAGVFTASGNKVQGVGLRKLYHSLLDERGLTGLGVNNEDTGDVELSFDGDEARRKEVFKELAARIRAKTNHPVTFAPTTVPQTSTPVKLSNKDSERLNAIHHLAYRMSNMYDPADPLMDPNDTFKQKLADRFRLQVNKRGLTGTVPSRAAEQLLGTRPMYAGMMPARRTRSEAEALSDMPMEQQQRLFKALKSGRGFLAPVVDKLASAAVEAPMNLYSYIPNGSIEHVKKHGLLSGNELAKPENRHLLDIARPKGDADRWLKERDARMLKSPWTNSYNGPSAFFGDIDAEKIHDKHPIKKFDTTRAVIKLRELLRDYPATKMEGSELIPFSDTTYDALDEKGQNEFVNKRHHTLSLDEIKALLTRGQNPKDMWKDFKDTEGKYYASDVPHAQVVTPMGKIPSKYIEFK